MSPREWHRRLKVLREQGWRIEGEYLDETQSVLWRAEFTDGTVIADENAYIFMERVWMWRQNNRPIFEKAAQIGKRFGNSNMTIAGLRRRLEDRGWWFFFKQTDDWRGFNECADQMVRGAALASVILRAAEVEGL